jgi:hypothetical protein
LKTFSAPACHSARIASIWSGLSMNLVRAVSAVGCSASEEPRLKNWVSSAALPSMALPLATNGELAVLAFGFAGRMMPELLWMYASCASTEAR